MIRGWKAVSLLVVPVLLVLGCSTRPKDPTLATIGDRSITLSQYTAAWQGLPDAAKPDVAPQRWDKPSYLDLSSGQASPWASEWARRDLGELQNELEGFLRH